MHRTTQHDGPPRGAVALLAAALGAGPAALAESIPLPEHPRPDFERAEWVNLNGPWSLRFDPGDKGEKESWHSGAPRSFPKTIVVPFPWGSKLSGVDDEATIAWYARTVRIPETWRGKRIFLVVGAADWHTTGWLDGNVLGKHRGGYTPFELELTPHASPGRDQLLVLRIDDTPHAFKLEGKQGYGPARGIWQTTYLEARPSLFLETVHFHPDVDRGKVGVGIRLSEPAPVDVTLKVRIDAESAVAPTGSAPAPTGPAPEVAATVRKGDQETAFTVPFPGARLWSLEDPYLHHAEVVLGGGVGKEDRVKTYFGMRKVSVEKLPGSGHAYIALNSRPVYLQLALDQAYHPAGFYTYPSDEFVRDEILRSLRIGLNGIRIHVKIDSPRKLHWADRLGLLVMADVPNSWGEPNEEMRREAETALRGMIRRDFNHPSIFSWVIFNETWGLMTQKEYLPATQEWVGSMYRLAKSLDPTRLVEDNSPCNLDHVATDINTWHKYLGGHEWREHLDQVVRDSSPGSKWNFIGGRDQGEEPLLNSECGNVWGYEGSTGDVDWSWEYHIMLNEFRRHPKVCGWLYTEHHDVINEWNGYYRFDRSPKVTGLAALVPGMSLRDLHGPFYIAPGGEMCMPAKPGEIVRVPLWTSFLTDTAPAGGLFLRAELHGWDSLGREEAYVRSERTLAFEPWLSREVEPLEVRMPEKRAVAVLRLVLEDGNGHVLHRNFTTFAVGDGASPRDETLAIAGSRARVLRIAPAGFRSAEWSLGRWDVLDGLKVNGAGHGHFEYAVPWPDGLDPALVTGASFVAELSAKQLFTKDQRHAVKQEGDFMRGKGTHDPSLNPNSYPMTDTVQTPSRVRIRVANAGVGTFDLPDDPADHRGILSWRSQLRDRKLREAGSYGYLVSAPIPAVALRAAAGAKEFVIRLEVDDSLPGGLAVYGERFGRYPIDPSIVLTVKE